MKKILIAAVFLTAFAVNAQNAKPDPMEDKDLMTWYHKDFANTSVYGINTQNAYKFLESKGLKPQTIIVGVLDSGVEVDHPGLIKNLWINPKEIANNGIDDDKNGYVDDIHGWNFIGNKTTDTDIDNMEVTRVVKKYQELFEGNNSAQNKANQAQMPEEFEMYMRSKALFQEKSLKAQQSYKTYLKIQSLIPVMVKMLNGNVLTQETLKTVKPADQDEAMAAQVLLGLATDPSFAGKNPQDVEKKLSEEMKEALNYFEPQANKQYNLDFDPRSETVGDNYEDYYQKSYGNNNYEGPDAEHGTHVAGIIAGLPQGREVQYGVAHKVAKIMTVRTVPNGDERDKDVANAIRYAVDNGARVVNMSFGKPVSPGKSVVWDAMKYAESKGVLLVKAAGNDNQDIAEHIYYPTNFKSPSDEKSFLSNMLVVGASTNNNESLRADFSNFNGKMVDVFAPGTEIYAPVPDYKYKYNQGTSMASPVVAGAAAVLWAYMPNLKAEQIIDALVKTVNTSTGNAHLPDNKMDRFDGISRAGGVVDLKKAAEYAYNNYYKTGAPKHKTTLKKNSVSKKKRSFKK